MSGDDPERISAALPLPTVVPPVHDYTSTACFHGAHDKCRLICKFCTARCACICHHHEEERP